MAKYADEIDFDSLPDPDCECQRKSLPSQWSTYIIAITLKEEYVKSRVFFNFFIVI